nr:diguanylate cyclase [uncultured Duganella sp.]
MDHALERQHPDLPHSVLGAVNLGAVVLDADARVVLWNAWMGRHAGVAGREAVGADFYALFPGLRGGRLEAAIGQALRANFASALSQSLNKAPLALYADAPARARGERLRQAIAVTPIAVAGAARHCLIQVTDVSVAVRRETLLREQAMVLRTQTFSDGLTGIANRRHFDVALEREHRRARRAGAPLSLLMIDIDHFKAYNDHYGHQQGDQCLIAVAGALAAMLKRPCDLVARYGGEEFAVILPELDIDQAGRVAEALRARVRALAIAQAPGAGAAGPASASTPATVTVSIGLTAQPVAAPVGVEALIGAADRALYQAKDAGRDRVAALAP